MDQRRPFASFSHKVYIPVFFILFLAAKCNGLEEGNLMVSAFQKELNSRPGVIQCFSLRDDSPEEIGSKVKFYLFTRYNKDAPDELIPGDVTSLYRSRFSTNRQTKVLIHGFADSTNGALVTNSKRNYLQFQDVNIIAVDWSDFSYCVDYIRVTKRIEPVGKYVARLLDFLGGQGYDFSGFHLIGHSLGAHIAGVAGRDVQQGSIPRITALDAALPGFIVLRRRVTSSDARFVDAIHTCGGKLGIYEKFADADFYVNGGKDPQPGCSAFDFGSCSHSRSHEYNAESIIPSHKFPTLLCEHEGQDPSECTQTSVLMGNPANDSARGIFYVFTLGKYPYAPIIS